jgi:hypothetical protein
MNVLLEIAIGLLLVGVVLGTAPWWLPIIDPWTTRYMDWIVRRLDRRGTDRGTHP